MPSEFPTKPAPDFLMNKPNNLEIDGYLRERPLVELLVEISEANLSGALRLENAAEKIVLYFDGGDLVFAVSNARSHRLFEIIARAGKLTVEQIKTIENFADDARLQKNLLARKTLSESELKEFSSRQADAILRSALAWENAEWIFSPLIRVRGEMHIKIDWSGAVFAAARDLANDRISRRLKNWQESFQKTSQISSQLDLTPAEGFVFSRFADGERLTATDVKNLSGLPDAEVFRALYLLWLGGFLRRLDWRKAFDEAKLAAIASARLVLKNADEKPAPPIEKISDVPKVSETVAAVQTKKNETNAEQNEITLDEYLERVENAASHYEMLGATLGDDGGKIKKIYFALAKRFHPDLFQRQTDAAVQIRIQHAFTEIAHAYETLKNDETRQIYNYKLRKSVEAGEVLPTVAQKQTETARPKDQTEMAEEYFDQGFTLLLDENYHEATPMLARAVYLVGDNARYHAYYGKALASDATTYRQAEAELQAALRLDTRNGDYRLMLAELFLKIGLAKRAEGELNRLLAIQPTNYEARQMLDSLARK